MSDVFVRAAALALAEAGDPTRARAALDPAIPPPAIARRPKQRAARVAWAASQIVAHAASPARAYRALSELIAALFEPIAGAPRTPPPAPELAMTLAPAALLEALCAPRVLAAELARLATLDARALLADGRADRRVLGVRAIAPAALAQHAAALAEAIAADPDPGVRVEALARSVHAGDKARAAVASALQAHASPPPNAAPPDGRDPIATRVAAIDALHALRVPCERAAELLADGAPAVRAAVLRGLGRGMYPDDTAASARLGDRDAGVRLAALAVLARAPALQTPAVVEPLLALLGDPGDTRPAIFLLGKLAPRVDRVLAALRDRVVHGRSDVALAAALVLRQLGAAVPELALDDRLARAARELAADVGDPETVGAGLHEVRRLAAAATPLIPALHGLAARLAPASALLGQVRELLAGLGEPLPPPRTALAGAPIERATHGAYAIGALPGALGVWDRGTGTRLVLVDGAAALAFVPGRAELAVVRVAGPAWHFERYAIPSGDRVATLAIPDAFTHGAPADLALAANLATVWCDDRAAPYRFHIKLGATDRLLDDAPVLGRRPVR